MGSPGDMTNQPQLPLGKLPHEFLEALLAKYRQQDSRVLVGPGIGEDAAVIEFGDQLLVAKSDPITFATESIGWYAVNVNANDIAAMGATPRWFLPVILLPDRSSDFQLADSIFQQIHDACIELGIVIVGGHTEITHGLGRPILCGQMLGEVSPDRLVTTAGAAVDDDIILTKGIAIEGTAVIGMEKEADLKNRGIADHVIAAARSYLKSPGISVVRDAKTAMDVGGVHSMHDPTEGGIVTGLREIAEAAGVGLCIEKEKIPVYPETCAFCDALGLDPFGLLASGSLVLTCDSAVTASLLHAIHSAGIDATRIGQVMEPERGLIWQVGGEERPFPEFSVDELARIF